MDLYLIHIDKRKGPNANGERRYVDDVGWVAASAGREKRSRKVYPSPTGVQTSNFSF